MKKNIVALSVCACAAMAFDSFELGKIEVTGQKEVNFASESINIADSSEISSKQKITDVLTEISGVSIQNSGARNEQMIMLRGFDSKHTPLYIDGIPIAVPYDGYVDFSRFLISDLAEIEVSKGFASPLLGANTFAGAVNMVTKKPKKELEAEANIGFFGKNGWNSGIALGTNQKNYYIQLALSKTKQDSSDLSDSFSEAKYSNTIGVIQPKGERLNSYFEDQKINLKVAYTPNETDEYSFNYIKQEAEKGVPPFTLENIATESSSTTARYWQWDYWDKESFYFISKTTFGNGHYIKARAFYDIFQNSLLQYTDKTYTKLGTGTSAPSYYDDNTAGASIEGVFSLQKDSTLGVSAHYKVDTHEEHIQNAATYKMQDEIASLGIEYKNKITDSTLIKIGASYDMEKVKQADDSNYPASTKQKEMSHGDANSLNPMFVVENSIDKDTLLFGGIAKKTRIPSIKDRYSYRFATYIANPDLKAESTINYEAGVKHSFGMSQIKASIFYMDISDYIQEVKNVSGTKSQLQNVGSVASKGLELDYNAIVSDTFSLGGNITLQNIKNENSSIKVTDVPEAMANLSIKYSPIKDLTWSNSARYEGSRYSSSTGALKSDSFVTINTGLGYKINKYASLEGGVDNLFDKNYALTYGYPEEGRRFWGNLRLKY